MTLRRGVYKTKKIVEGLVAKYERRKKRHREEEVPLVLTSEKRWRTEGAVGGGINEF